MSKMNVIRFIVVRNSLLLFVTLSLCCVDAKGEERTGSEGVEEVLQAKSRSDLSTALRALFATSTGDHLAILRRHANNGIAITAAWERLVRSGLPIQTNDRLPLGAAPTNRFLGFVEGRLNCNLPVWWASVITSGEVDKNKRFYFDLLATEFAYQETESGIAAPIGVKARKGEENLHVSIGEKSCRIALTDLRGRSRIIHGLNALIANKRCYVAAHTSHCSPYKIACVDTETMNLLWTNEVFTRAGSLLSVSGPRLHFVDLRKLGNSILLFGVDDHSAYIESFSVNDGSSSFRFMTDY